MTTCLSFANEPDLLAALVADWRETGSEVLRRRGAFNAALVAGDAPENFYRELGKIDWPWSATRLFIVNERPVPPRHAESNYRKIYRAFRPRAVNLERWKTEAFTAENAAGDYERRLTRLLGRPPRLDYALLDIGADGRTGALFPGAKPPPAPEKFALAVRSPQTNAQHLTLTCAALHQARAIRFIAAGAAAQPFVRRMEQGSPCDFPAGAVTCERGEIKIFNHPG